MRKTGKDFFSPFFLSKKKSKIKLSNFIFFFIFIFLFSPLVHSQEPDCLTCHSDKDLTATRDNKTIPLYIDKAQYDSSAHKEISCKDCHSDIAPFTDMHDSPLGKVNCGNCHDSEAKQYEGSVHQKPLKHNPSETATCSTCHGKHDILSSSNPFSTTNPSNLVKTCGRCHSDPKIIPSIGMKKMDPVKAYELSIHGQKLKNNPSLKVATCNECHGGHAIYLQTDPRSSFSKMNISNTCGKCHPKENSEYKESIHYEAVQFGYFGSPSCIDCHGEHGILSHDNKESPTNKLLVASNLCADCHSNKTLMKRFGLDSERISSYNKTYHGMALMKGSEKAASCISCHETHAIRTHSSPKSSINPANLKVTCGKCHGKVEEKFIATISHPIDQKTRNPIAYYIRISYIILILLSVGGMVAHNLVIHSHFLRRKFKQLKLEEKYRRFTGFQAIQHAFLLSSFFILVITGFALKYSDSTWAILLQKAGMTETLRALIHRIAAVIMILSSFAQIFYLLFTKPGRKDVFALIPSFRDVKGFIENMLYHLHLKKEHPHFGRFDYTEKFEYLALIWGTIVMVVTGFILWAPKYFIGKLPAWVFEASEVIHYYEAWLATLSILIWHFYFVILHPEKYPLNMTFLSGKITLKEELEHHPEEYEKEKKSSV